MKVGLLLNSNNKLCSYSEKFRTLLLDNKIDLTLIDPNADDLFEQIKECSHLIFRHSQGDTDKIVYEAIFTVVNKICEVNCWPNFETSWPYEDKIREYYLLKNSDFPIINSHVFWNYNSAEQFLMDTHFPVVVKLSKGASSRNVVIVNSMREGKRIIGQVFKKGVKTGGLKSRSNLSSLSKSGILKYCKSRVRAFLTNTGVMKNYENYPEWQIQKDAILFQKFLPNNSYDTRVTVIGNRAFAYRRFVRPNDFRASGSGNFKADPKEIDKRCIEMAFKVSKKLNFVTMAYDFIYDEEKRPFVNEISYCFVDWMVQSCPGYWDEDMVWHPGQNWPQYYQLTDFLKVNLEH